MIQFNLLPSVKLEYVKARRNKRLTILAAALAGTASLAVLVLLFVSIQIIQKKYSSDLTKDIKKESSKLQGVTELNKILTIQNQLASLTTLHDQKPVTTRLYTYIKQLTPAHVSIATLNIDFEKQTVDITGAADNISLVNKFVDTLKFTTYKAEDKSKNPLSGYAFSGVVLASFGRDDKQAPYQVTLKFDPIIFASDSNPTLIVPPSKVTTRSETEKLDDPLFKPLTNDNGAKQ